MGKFGLNVGTERKLLHFFLLNPPPQFGTHGLLCPIAVTVRRDNGYVVALVRQTTERQQHAILLKKIQG